MTPSRPRYHERAFLRQNDLEQEQRHRIDARRRHNLGAHGWGIAAGLEITTATELAVQPGYAIDGYGRELIVPRQIVIPDATFAQLNVAVVDIWLVYFCEPIVSRQPGRTPAAQSVRWREEARLRVEATERDRPLDPRRPPIVPPADYDLGPQRLPPDDAHAVWPVWLGRIVRNTDPTLSYTQISLPRPYITLRGEMIASPSGRRDPDTDQTAADASQVRRPATGVRVQVGAELATDRRRFVVSLSDAGGAYTDRLTLNRDGTAELGGPTTLYKPLKLGAEPDASGAIQFRPLDEPPKTATPWRIYGVKTIKDAIETHALRFEIHNPGTQGDPGRNLFTIGCSADDRFVAGLAVAANGTVTAEDLVITDGQLVEQPITANPNDPRFGEKVLEGLSQGLALEMKLQFDLSGVPDSKTAGSQLEYKIGVKNTGTVKISNVVVYATQIVAGVVRLQNQRLAVVPPDLDPGAEHPGEVKADDLKISVPADANYDIQIILVAIGEIAPAGRAFGSASKSTRITA
ncbi:MAG TPA: hypothetical protein VGD58_28455 [Herpetosiphonaceae bacterium]